jgi:tellurite methyltransferase
MRNLAAEFGDIDIYWFDQLLRGRIVPGMRILDAGCGAGRNLAFLMREGFDVYGVDADPDAVAATIALAARNAPSLPADHFRVEPVERMSFPDAHADVVIASALFHFARDDDHFRAMLGSCWRVLRPGGLFFSRLASSTGLAPLQAMGGRRFVLPDGSTRYLVDEEFLIECARALGGTLADPLKTTLVHGKRCMTTWVLRKGA